MENTRIIRARAKFDGGLWKEKNTVTATFDVDGEQRVVYAQPGSPQAAVLLAVKKGQERYLTETTIRRKDSERKVYRLVSAERHAIFTLAAAIKAELPAAQQADISRSDLITMACAIYNRAS